MLKRNNPKKKMIALDTNALIAIEYLYNLQQDESIKSEKLEISQDILSNPDKKKVAEELVEMFKNGNINFFIPPQVYFEISNKEYICNFVAEHCYMPKINEDGSFDGEEEVERLANLYIKPYVYINKDGEERISNSAMDPHPDATRMKKFLPDADAYIMAWCSIYGINLLTDNEKHFVSVCVNKLEEKNTYRRERIVYINIQEGLLIEQVAGKPIVAAPYTFLEISSKLRYIHDKELGDLDSGKDVLKIINLIFKEQEEEYRNPTRFDDNLDTEEDNVNPGI